MALLCAAAALFGALLACLGPARSVENAGAHAAPSPASTYNCPYDQGDCGAFPHLSPAVLTAAPPDAPPSAAALPVRHGGEGTAAKSPRGDGTWARAPGAHVLMVLRR
ncbi:hypothetical protein ACIQM4_33775 [Streptomyces sp. NPDC091272]|uniref:hypothetical protein n=1 Tax=Streptomyces sp. NPDC091272 TaxID=3365981 RepID=UPI00382EFB52